MELNEHERGCHSRGGGETMPRAVYDAPVNTQPQRSQQVVYLVPHLGQTMLSFYIVHAQIQHPDYWHGA